MRAKLAGGMAGYPVVPAGRAMHAGSSKGASLARRVDTEDVVVAGGSAWFFS